MCTYNLHIPPKLKVASLRWFCSDQPPMLDQYIDPIKACGPDEIPGRLLKEGAPWLASPLTKLLPLDWTSANVTPIFKNVSKHNPKNYRPVSLTCIAIKVLEWLIHERFYVLLGWTQQAISVPTWFLQQALMSDPIAPRSQTSPRPWTQFPMREFWWSSTTLALGVS